MFVFVPSLPLPGFHIPLKRAAECVRFLSGRLGDNGRVSDHFWFQFKNVAAGIWLNLILILSAIQP